MTNKDKHKHKHKYKHKHKEQTKAKTKAKAKTKSNTKTNSKTNAKTKTMTKANTNTNTKKRRRRRQNQRQRQQTHVVKTDQLYSMNIGTHLFILNVYGIFIPEHNKRWHRFPFRDRMVRSRLSALTFAFTHASSIVS
jgi:hypothetical protein